MLNFIRVIENTCVFLLHIPGKLAVKRSAFSSHFSHLKRPNICQCGCILATWRLRSWRGKVLNVTRRCFDFISFFGVSALPQNVLSKGNWSELCFQRILFPIFVWIGRWQHWQQGDQLEERYTNTGVHKGLKEVKGVRDGEKWTTGSIINRSEHIKGTWQI